MKSLSLSIMFLLFASFAAAQTVALHGSGAQAEAFGNTVRVIVTSGLDNNGSPATLLTFFAASPNPDGTITFVNGFGFIPNDAFAQQGPDSMSLNVDTSQVAGYTNTTCIFTPFPNFGFQCSPSQGGPLQVSWHANGLNSDDESRNVTLTMGPITQHDEGNFQLSSADAQGSVVGTSFALTGGAFNAFVSQGHSVQVTVTQN
jgi:hypothetical protein